MIKTNYLLNFIRRCAKDAHIEDIQSIFIVPSALITPADLVSHTAYYLQQDNDHKISYYGLKGSNDVKVITHTIPKVTSYTDYTPKNNKCFCYPMNYLYVTNNNGNYNIYKYEDFYNSANATFDTILSMNIGVSGKLTPTNYKNQSTKDFDNGLSLGKFPTCGWSTDAFTSWLTSQCVNIATSWVPRSWR